LVPAAITIAFDTRLLESLSGDLTRRNADAMARQALTIMQRLLGDYAATLDREGRRVERLLALQAREAERALHADDTPATATWYDDAFDRADPALGLTDTLPGTRLAVSWQYPSLHLAPGTTHDAVAREAAALAGMADFFRTIRVPHDPLLRWHYVALESGLSVTYPGHGGNPAAFDPRTRPWYSAHRAGDQQPRWNRPHYDASTGALLINATLPVRAADGGFAGATGIDVDLSASFALLELPPHLRAGSELLHVAALEPPQVTSPQVLVLARQRASALDPDWQTLPDIQPLDLGNRAATAALREALLASESGRLELDVDGQPSFVLFQRYGETPTAVVLKVPVASATQAAREARDYAAETTTRHVRMLFAIVVMVTIAVIIVALYAARHLTRPIEELDVAVARLAEGDLGARVRITTRDELAALGTAFNAMVPRLKAHARVEESLALAREVQQQLLPPAPPALLGYDIAGITRYSEQTGGDYFDYLELDCGDGARTAIVVADVAGHGIAPALLMATTRALLHGGRHRGHAPGELLGYVNHELADDVARGQFVTLFLLAVEPGSGALTWSSAGHDAALLFRAADGRIDELASGDIPLGIDADWQYASECGVSLAPGDLVLLGTDGIWETANANGERFGKARVREFVAARAQQDAAALCAALESALADFRDHGAQHDDLTIMVIKRLAADSATA
ncbi:MAG: SpoIIE family protein phosphatase, partial [Gammaproteobacteria bacterium]